MVVKTSERHQAYVTVLFEIEGAQLSEFSSACQRTGLEYGLEWLHAHKDPSSGMLCDAF